MWLATACRTCAVALRGAAIHRLVIAPYDHHRFPGKGVEGVCCGMTVERHEPAQASTARGSVRRSDGYHSTDCPGLGPISSGDRRRWFFAEPAVGIATDHTAPKKIAPKIEEPSSHKRLLLGHVYQSSPLSPSQIIAPASAVT